MNNIVLIQEMVNDYLKNNNKKTITELLAAEGKDEKLGVLTPSHKIVLQQMIHEYCKNNGFDLDSKLKYGKQILGVISEEEMKYIEPLVNEYKLSQIKN
jgi:hypothetical protein